MKGCFKGSDPLNPEYVRSRMRAGYKAYEYNRLMEKERIAKEGIAKYCK